MNLPPSILKELPSTEQRKLAEDAWMVYVAVYSNGIFQHWKLKHKKSKKPCGC